MEYLRIPNWEDYQHYKDRAPPWIKLHNALLDDYEFCSLPDAAKFQVICLWLLASRLNNIIPADPDWIANRIGANTPVDLAVLLEAGFIEPVPAEHVATQTEQVATQDKKGAGAMSKTAPAWGNRHIPKAIKELVHERDNGTCQTCGSTENIEFDHIVPISKGGVSIDSNLQLLCRSCNRRKRAKPAEQVATQDAGADSGLRSLEGEGEGEGEGEDEVIAAIEKLQKEGIGKLDIEDMMETSEPEVQMDNTAPLETARKKLQTAIDDERYEDAARLRDEIKQMEQKA